MLLVAANIVVARSIHIAAILIVTVTVIKCLVVIGSRRKFLGFDDG